MDTFANLDGWNAFTSSHKLFQVTETDSCVFYIDTEHREWWSIAQNCDACQNSRR